MIARSVHWDEMQARALRAPQVIRKRHGNYATSEDFCKLFIEDTNSLHLLSFLLTANQEKAERCFVAGLDDCLDGEPVFHRWAHTWARRVIVRNAIRVVVPRPDLKTPVPQKPVQSEQLGISAHNGGFAGVLALEDFERFVFVLSVLEKYSEKDCALLLDVSIQEVREARARVEQHIAGFDTRNVEWANALIRCHEDRPQR